jgi:hypothetical protein
MGFTKRKKYQKRKTRRRKQHGGATGSNLRFRYTQLPERIAWITSVSQYGSELIRMISNIPYETYRFQGMCDLFVPIDEENFDSGLNILRSNGDAVAQNPAYQIFGGTACEIYNMAYPEAAKLYDTTDPTGDIDVKLFTPLFTPTDRRPKDEENPTMYTEEHGYNPVSDNYTRWVMEHIRAILEILSTQYAKELEQNGFVKASREDTFESNTSDISIDVGPFLICRLYRDGMIKIQALAKIQSLKANGDSMEYADHFMEFVMVNPTQNFSDITLTTDYSRIQHTNIYVDSPMKLLRGQIKGLNDRQKIGLNTHGEKINSPIKHKLINHYGRLMYITKLIRWLVDTRLILRPSTDQFTTLINTLTSPAFERNDVCEPPRGCSAYAILQPILPFLLPGYPSTQKAKKIRHPNAIKGLGNLEYIDTNLFK